MFHERILFGIRYSEILHERIVFGICKYLGPNSTNVFLFKIQINVWNIYCHHSFNHIFLQFGTIYYKLPIMYLNLNGVFSLIHVWHGCGVVVLFLWVYNGWYYGRGDVVGNFTWRKMMMTMTLLLMMRKLLMKKQIHLRVAPNNSIIWYSRIVVTK